MLLCIDIGNTNTVLATFDGEKLVHSWRVKTEARSTADELGLMFRGLLATDNVQSPVIHGSGHFVAEEAPEEMLAALTAFLAPYRDG